MIGALGAAAFVVEGGIESWSALFLERQLHAHPDVSGLGPGVFGGAMAAGRFFGHAVPRPTSSFSPAAHCSPLRVA